MSFFFFQAEDGIRDHCVTGVQTCALPILSSILGSLNYISTIINNRAPGMTWFRLPLSVWSLFITAILGLLALPVLSGAAIMLLFDQVLNTHFFDPAAGGQALLDRKSVV